MFGLIGGFIWGDYNDDLIKGIVTGVAFDFVLATTSIVGAVVCTNLDNNAQTRIRLKGEETNNLISSKIGEDFTLLTIDATKGKDEQKQLKLFGESNKYVDGLKCSTMTNYTISVSDEQYSNFVKGLKNVVEKGKLDNNTYRGNLNVLGDYTATPREYESSIINVYDVISDYVKNSKDYTVTTCGVTSSMLNILKKEYNFSTPDTLSDVSGRKIRTNFVDNGLALLNVSDVEKNNGNNYVYVNTLQPNSAEKTWSLCTGRFKVAGDNLTQDQVFDKIYDGDYKFIPGDKQTHKSISYDEDNDAIFNF